MQSIIARGTMEATSPQRDRGLLFRAVSAMAGALGKLREHREIRSAEHRLMNMSDHELKDIGLTRGRIASAVLGHEGVTGETADRRARG